LRGWSPKRRIGIQHFPMQHFVVAGKDYLMAVNIEGEVHLFDRRGHRRSRKIKLDTYFPNPFHVQIDSRTFRLINADTNGVVFTVHPNRDFERQLLDSSLRGHAFACLPLSDDRLAYVFTDGSHAVAYDREGQTLFNHAFNHPVEKRIQHWKLNGREGFTGYVSAAAGQLLLLNENGALHPAFPLQGAAPFAITDLFDDGRLKVVTGDKDSFLRCYRMK